MFENEFVEWVCRYPQSKSGVLIGPGDDAALVGSQGGMLVTTDLLTEGVHFLLGGQSPERIGRKALAVSLSDIAAMGGVAQYALVQLVLPKSLDADYARRLQSGIFALAAEYGVAIVGGDTNRWDAGLVIGTTVMGRPGPGGTWRLGGAKAGDRILVSGVLGGSLAGHHLDFVPRLELAAWLGAGFDVHAATDISDSLTVDLANLADQSGLAAVVNPAAIPISAAATQMAERGGKTALEHALTDGEDFELLIAVSPETSQAILQASGQGAGIGSAPPGSQGSHSAVGWAPGRPFVQLTEIGYLTEGDGLWLKTNGHPESRIAPSGYEH